ncbi:DUF2521 family protein [Ectobacillus ponti]|uniref:YbaK family protein n=1 Tax=Ectobacillus ponti TaxID=2961894 RepID=A0AA41X991_9BACI|nr:DUF2521 family protein [Ectobacillus ponti]MCP8971147.1 YbaK family protein [Ectobacillus ponti]
MNVITTFKDKRREKQLKYERRMLKEISLTALRKHIQQCFENYTDSVLFSRHCEEYCIELAIESYLLGARYSKFGYYGEPLMQVRDRACHEEQDLTELLFHFMQNVPIAEMEEEQRHQLYELCQSFITSWWTEGYEKGERRYRLRLH